MLDPRPDVQSTEGAYGCIHTYILTYNSLKQDHQLPKLLYVHNIAKTRHKLVKNTLHQRDQCAHKTAQQIRIINI